MIFRRIVSSALLIGLLVGLVLTAAQQIGVVPIILAAETYELPEVAPMAGHGHEDGHVEGHHHHGEAWAPEEGWERTFYTLLSNVLAAMGFSLVLMALMCQLQLLGLTQLNWQKGALWGLAGFICAFLTPALGLPPEIPGVEAAAVGSRQNWWLFTVLFSSGGLMALWLLSGWVRLAGLILLALPFVVGAPHASGPLFTHPDPEAVAALTELHTQFVLISGFTNLLFWLMLGVACAAVIQVWRPIPEPSAEDAHVAQQG